MTTSRPTSILSSLTLKALFILFMTCSFGMAQDDASEENDIIILVLGNERNIFNPDRSANPDIPFFDETPKTTTHDRQLAEDNSDDEDVGDPEGRKKPDRPWIVITNLPTRDEWAGDHWERESQHEGEEPMYGASLPRGLSLLARLANLDPDYLDEALYEAGLQFNNLDDPYEFQDEYHEDDEYQPYMQDNLLMSEYGSDAETMDMLREMIGFSENTQIALLNGKVKVMLVLQR